MSNIKLTRNPSAKRSNSFLPEDVRKEFGGCVKKPRLDVRLTQLTPHSPNKSTINSQISPKEPVAEDVWGEDLCEEAVEKCIFLASQALPEESSSTSAKDSSILHENSDKTRGFSTISRTTFNGFKLPTEVSGTSSNSKPQNRNVSKPFSSKGNKLENSSYYFPKPSISKTVQKEKKIEHKPSCSKTAQEEKQIEHGSNLHDTDVRKLEMEYQALKESFVLKEGEVSILRSQLKQLQLQIETQAIEHRKSLEAQVQKYRKELNEQKRELDVTNTQLQFQIMEATTIRNHCKFLESNSKMKLVEPQAFSPSSEKKKMEGSKEKQNPGPSTPKKNKIQVTDEAVNPHKSLNSREMCISCNNREGPVLGKLINRYLFQNSAPDITWILYMRKKQSLYKKIKEAEGINSKILTLQKNTRTLERSYTAVNKLITLDSASSTAAYPYIMTIIRECHEIVCRQMNILRLLFDVQTHSERVVLNGVIVSCIGTLAGKSDNHLMSARPWYEDEEGIESRRALGLLCALCDISYIAADLIGGSSKLQLEPGCFYRNLRAEDVSRMEGVCEGTAGPSSDFTFVEDINYMEYYSKPHGFLYLLRDLAFSISVQRRSQHFIGILTGILKLLCTVAKSSTFTDDGVEVVIEIIREIVFCCPQVEVIVVLFELLALLSSYSVVMKALCKNSEPEAFVDKRHIGLTYFTRDSCIIQVLYRLLPNCETSVSLRTQLCCHMIHWLYSVTCFLGKEKPWLLDLTGNIKRSCHCRQSLAQGLVTSLYNTLCDIDQVWSAETQIKWEIQEALGKGIILLRVWLQQDKEFWKNFGRDPFGCQLMLSRIQTELTKLDLNAMQTECVNGLMNVDKESQEETSLTEGDEDNDNYWNTMSSDCKILFFE